MTTDTLTRTEFLLARIAEDEADWRAVDARDVQQLLHGRPLAPKMLADVAAKRRIVAYFADVEPMLAGTSARVYDDSYCRAGRAVLAVLAQPYADHDDYREEWTA